MDNDINEVSALKIAEVHPPLHGTVFVPTVTPEPQPLFCRLQGLGVTASPGLTAENHWPAQFENLSYLAFI